jgi:hypothetical protein
VYPALHPGTHVFAFVSYVYVPFGSVAVHVHPVRVALSVALLGHMVHAFAPVSEYVVAGHW